MPKFELIDDGSAHGYFELIFEGTPYEFVHEAISFSSNTSHTDDMPTFQPVRDYEKDADFAEIIFFPNRHGQPEIGARIQARIRKTNQLSTLRVVVAYGDWPLLKRTWERLYEELDRQGRVSLLREMDTPVKEKAKHDKRRQARSKQNADTEEKIDELKNLRCERIAAGKVTVTRTVACNIVGVDPKTVKKHAPDLWKGWDSADKKF